MMKRMKHVLALLFAAATTITAGATVKAEPYNYKVTLLPGRYGTIDGSKKAEFEVPYNETVTIGYDGNNNAVVSYGNQTYKVVMNTGEDAGRFYCKGFHFSGIETVIVAGEQPITEDTVLVASYGMKSRSVAYTVKFQDANGNELAEDRTFYGNIGDKPVIACIYIENWVPDASAETKTLSADASENVFIFTYHPAEKIPGGGGGTTGEGGYTYIDDGTIIVYLPGGGGTPAGGRTPGNTTGNNTVTNVTPAADESKEDSESAEDAEANEPADIIDLDNIEKPEENITSPEPETEPVINQKPGLSPVWITALTASGLGSVALIAILILLLKRRKNGQYER